jgi:hypothetical protein
MTELAEEFSKTAELLEHPRGQALVRLSRALGGPKHLAASTARTWQKTG